MKKIISLLLCLAVMIGSIGTISASAKVTFVNHNTFYEENDNYEDQYYTIIDGVCYTIIEQCCDDFGYVSAILPPKDCKKIEILDEIDFGAETVQINTIDIENEYMFHNLNSSLEEIVIGDNIHNISGINFFPNLKKVTLGSESNNINNCFVGCKNLETLEGNSKYILEDGVIYSCVKNKRTMITAIDETIDSLEVKEGTTSIYSPFGTYLTVTVKNLFVNENLETLKTGRMKKLRTITFGENVNSIKNIDLNGVRNLKTLDLSNIEVGSFNAKGVWHLTSVTFGKINKLVKHSFRGCKKIEKIVFEDEIPKISKDAFKNKKSGIKFYVKNKRTAKSLKKQLKNSGAKKPKIYIGKKLYK